MSAHTSLSDHCNWVPSSPESDPFWATAERDLVYVHSNLKLLKKLQSLDDQEANTDWERWAVSDSDSSEEEQ